MVLLRACVGDLPFRLPNCRCVIYNNLTLEPQQIQVLLISNFMGEGV